MKGLSLLKNHSAKMSKKKGMQFSKKSKKSMKSHLTGDMKSHSISPSVEEFDKMMSSVSGKSSKKKMFMKKKK